MYHSRTQKRVPDLSRLAVGPRGLDDGYRVCVLTTCFHAESVPTGSAVEVLVVEPWRTPPGGAGRLRRGRATGVRSRPKARVRGGGGRCGCGCVCGCWLGGGRARGVGAGADAGPDSTRASGCPASAGRTAQAPSPDEIATAYRSRLAEASAGRQGAGRARRTALREVGELAPGAWGHCVGASVAATRRRRADRVAGRARAGVTPPRQR